MWLTILLHMDMLNFVKDNVSTKYEANGVILDDISYRSDIRLPEKLKEAINDKIEATQLALKTEAQIQQTEAEAKKVIAQARGELAPALICIKRSWPNSQPSN